MTRSRVQRQEKDVKFVSSNIKKQHEGRGYDTNCCEIMLKRRLHEKQQQQQKTRTQQIHCKVYLNIKINQIDNTESQSNGLIETEAM